MESSTKYSLLKVVPQAKWIMGYLNFHALFWLDFSKWFSFFNDLAQSYPKTFQGSDHFIFKDVDFRDVFHIFLSFKRNAVETSYELNSHISQSDSDDCRKLILQQHNVRQRPWWPPSQAKWWWAYRWWWTAIIVCTCEEGQKVNIYKSIEIPYKGGWRLGHCSQTGQHPCSVDVDYQGQQGLSATVPHLSGPCSRPKHKLLSFILIPRFAQEMAEYLF